jgi:hypothetical protein
MSDYPLLVTPLSVAIIPIIPPRLTERRWKPSAFPLPHAPNTHYPSLVTRHSFPVTPKGTCR